MKGPILALAGVAAALVIAAGLRIIALASTARRLLIESNERTRRETERIEQATRALRAQNNARARAIGRQAAAPDEGMWAPHHLSECKNIRCPRHAADGRWIGGPHPGERR